MKFTPNPKIFLGLAALALVGGGAGSYFQFQALGELDEKAKSLQAQLRNPQDVQKELDESTKQVNEALEKLSHLEKGVPQMAYVATLLAELDHIGTDNGIEVLGVRPIPKQASKSSSTPSGEGETPKRKAYEELNIEIKGRGNYQALLDFMEALKRFPKIVAARTVGVAPKANDRDKTGELDIQIELRAYLFPTAPAKSSTAFRKSEEAPNNG